MLSVYLSRGDGNGDWSWWVQEDEFPAEGEFLPVPYDQETDEYDIGSRVLRSALVVAGYDPDSRHWQYIDGDYGPIGEWNRPEEVA